MSQFPIIFMFCMCFAYAQSEECSGIKLGKTGCVPQEHSLTILSQPPTEPPNSPLPIYIAMEKYRVTEIDISSSTMKVVIAVDLFWKDNR